MKKTIIMMSMAAAMLTAVTGCKPVCNEWYEADGTKCVEVREQFYGTYTGTMTTDGQSANGQLVISENSAGVNYLSFLLQTGNSTMVLTSEEGAFNIPLQNIYIQGVTYSIEGSGSFSGSQLVMNYVATYQSSNIVVNFTGTK